MACPDSREAKASQEEGRPAAVVCQQQYVGLVGEREGFQVEVAPLARLSRPLAVRSQHGSPGHSETEAAGRVGARALGKTAMR